MPIGGLLGGWLGAWLGVVPALWVGVGISAASALPVVLSPLVTMTTLPRYQELPAEAAEPQRS
jgi:hypothetical protein